VPSPTTKRIAFARVFQETCPFSPLPTEQSHFSDMHLLRGEELWRACAIHRTEVAGFLRNAELSGMRFAVDRHHALGRLGRNRSRFELAPLLSTAAKPSGKVTRAAYEWIRDELCERLRQAMPVDGVFLALHGSMQAEGCDRRTPEEELLGLVRAEVGPDVPIAATFDLHAHLTPGIVREADVLCPYLTNPHRDYFGTGRRAAELLMGALAGELRPTHAWRKLPVAYGGGLMLDFWPPLRRVFRRLRELQRSGQVLYASLCTVHPFTEAPDIGWVVHVTTDDDPERAEALADEIAELAWRAAQQPVPEFHSPARALELAREAWLARKTGVVSLVDTSDVVTAGATGGSTSLLKHLVDHPSPLRIYVPLHDPAALEELRERPPGDPVELQLRGTPGLENNPTVACRGVLLGHHRTVAAGRAATVQIDRLTVVLTEQPPVTIWPRLFHDVELDPWRADAIVQKAFFHYRWFFGLYNRRNIPVDGHGPTRLENVRRVPRATPLIPFDTIDDWRPHDAILRGR
jgi:microcystin degradation protein MlrC